MTARMALRALATRPVRSAVLICGFGCGIGAMAVLLGVGDVIVDQALSPALEGGGHVVISGGDGQVGSARFVMERIRTDAAWREEIVAVSPSRTERLYLIRDESTMSVEAQGVIPSLERQIEHPETVAIAAWTDVAGDEVWSRPDPGELLRAMDRFHPIPEVPERAGSWAEWLYFNGRAGEVRFYLSFLFGPISGENRRTAVVRLQLERDGRTTNYSLTSEVPADELLAGAPDVSVGGNGVELEQMTYRITLDLEREDDAGGRLTGELRLVARPGQSLPPFTVHGARGWRSGYVAPVLSGTLDGEIRVAGETISLAGGNGYHDHNWGFWEGVTWRWGQVAHDDVSILYGRIQPPADAADANRMPGFLAVLGPDGPLGFSTAVTIAETDTGEGRPVEIRVRATGGEIDLQLDLDIVETQRTKLGRSESRDFLQLRANYRVSGSVGDRRLDFTAPGAAETFRGMGSPSHVD